MAQEKPEKFQSKSRKMAPVEDEPTYSSILLISMELNKEFPAI